MADRLAAWILIVGGVLARATLVLVLGSHEVPRSTYEHGEIAENLLAGRGFAVKFLGADGATSQQAPLYPVIVAGAYALGGGATPRSLLILELGQSILGGCLVWAVMALAREVLPGRAGLWPGRIAGFAAAFHPTLVYAATHVQVALPATLLLTLSLAQGYKTGRTGRAADALFTGLWLGLLMLTDPILGLASLGIAWAILQGRRCVSKPVAAPRSIKIRRMLKTPRDEAGRLDLSSTVQGVGLVAVAAVTALLVLLPWTIRNYRVHGEFVAIKSTFGYAFWQGNSVLSEGTDKVARPSTGEALGRSGPSLRDWNASLWKARHAAGYLDDIALSKADYQMLAKVSEPERSRILFQRALADLHAEPGRYLKLTLRRLRYFVLFDETNPKTRNLVYRGSQLGLTIFAGLGILMMPRPIRSRLGPTFLTALLITLFHALTIVSARFHLPIEPLMAVWGAMAFAFPRHAVEDNQAGPAAARAGSTAVIAKRLDQPRLPATS